MSKFFFTNTPQESTTKKTELWTNFGQTKEQTLAKPELRTFSNQILVSDAQWLLNAFFTLIFKIILYAVKIVMKKWKSFEVVKIQNITCLFWIIIQTFECFNIFFYSQH